MKYITPLILSHLKHKFFVPTHEKYHFKQIFYPKLTEYLFCQQSINIYEIINFPAIQHVTPCDEVYEDI